MSIHVEFLTTIKSGLPVEVQALIHPAEPDVGIFEPQVEISDIRWQSGRPVPQDLFDYAMQYDRAELELEALEARYG